MARYRLLSSLANLQDYLLAVPPEKGTTHRRLVWILKIIPGHLANLTLHIGGINYFDIHIGQKKGRTMTGPASGVRLCCRFIFLGD